MSYENMSNNHRRGWWHRFISSPKALLASAAFGAPGVLDNFTFWRNAVGDLSAGWQGVLIGGSAILFLAWLINFVERHWGFIRTHWKDFGTIAGGVVVLAAIGGIIYALYYGAFIYERPRTVWTHLTLTIEEQEKVKARCAMRAMEVSGGPFTQRDYKYACLTAEGFVSKEVRDGEGPE